MSGLGRTGIIGFAWLTSEGYRHSRKEKSDESISAKFRHPARSTEGALAVLSRRSQLGHGFVRRHCYRPSPGPSSIRRLRFSKDELPSRDILTQALPFLMQSKILQDQKNTLSVLATPLGDPEKTVNVSLFGGINF